MPSPNLSITHVAAAQNQKEVTINDAVDVLDNAMNRALSLAMADADLTLTATQANRNGLVVLTGALTAPRTVTLPANHRRLALRNATTGDFAITVKYPGSGATVAVPPETTALLQGNGVDLYGVAGGGGGATTFLGLEDTPAAYAPLKALRVNSDGDGLIFDDFPQITAGSNWAVPLRGALVHKDASQALTSGSGNIITWQSALYDSHSFYDAAQSRRLTVTAASKATFVRLVFAVETDSASVANPNLTILKNGEFVAGAARLEGGSSSTANGRWYFALTAPLAVTAGDYFEGRFFLSTSGREAVASAHTFFAIEVLETSEAENPPEPVEAFLAGTPPASSVVFKKVAARPFRLEDDMAGCQSHAGTAPAGGPVELEVRRNGTSIGTIAFADGAASATFATGGSGIEAFEAGDRLEVVTPAELNGLADIAIALAAART